MMRMVGVPVALLLLLSGVCLAYVGQGAESLVLPMDGKYGAVEVPHWGHQESLGDCNACHGIFPQEAGSIERLRGEKRLKKKQVMNNCRGCHRSRAKASEASGPVKCFDCHAAG